MYRHLQYLNHSICPCKFVQNIPHRMFLMIRQNTTLCFLLFSYQRLICFQYYSSRETTFFVNYIVYCKNGNCQCVNKISYEKISFLSYFLFLYTSWSCWSSYSLFLDYFRNVLVSLVSISNPLYLHVSSARILSNFPIFIYIRYNEYALTNIPLMKTKTSAPSPPQAGHAGQFNTYFKLCNLISQGFNYNLYTKESQSYYTDIYFSFCIPPIHI